MDSEHLGILECGVLVNTGFVDDLEPPEFTRIPRRCPVCKESLDVLIDNLHPSPYEPMLLCYECTIEWRFSETLTEGGSEYDY